MNSTLVSAYKEVKALHHKLFTQVVKSSKSLVDNCTLADQVDNVYSLKKTEEMLDDIRKEITKLRRDTETRVCLNFYIEEVEKIKTPHCSAKVSVKQFASYPHKRRQNPDKFDDIMESLCIPPDVVASEAVRINWEGFSNWFSLRQERGMPLPKGVDIDEVYTEYTVATRKIKDVDEV